jgi:tellurite resistance protein
MLGFFTTLMTDYRTELERHKNRPFLNASMAACALVAATDGGVSLVERVRVDQIFARLNALRVFDPHGAVDAVNEFTQAIVRSPRDGRAKALKAVEAMAGDPERAELVICMCLALSEAEGDKSLVDQVEIVTLCSLLGVDPRARGLYTDLRPQEFLDPST